MSVDVEDYFQVSAFEKIIDRDSWERLDHRIEKASANRDVNMDQISNLRIFTDRLTQNKHSSSIKFIFPGKDANRQNLGLISLTRVSLART